MAERRISRRLATSLTLALCAGGLALAVAGVALAGAGNTYRGALERDPKATVAVKVKRDDGRRVVRRFRVRSLKLHCEDGVKARLPVASLAGAAVINSDGRFLLDGRSRAEALRVEGKVGRGGRMRGTLRYSGKAEFTDGSRNCRSGKRAWTARR